MPVVRTYFREDIAKNEERRYSFYSSVTACPELLATSFAKSGSRGRMLAARSVNCYARSMRAFCCWLELEEYVEVAPSKNVKMSKVGKPLIRIIEFEELEL